jgi:hypothetical protein
MERTKSEHAQPAPDPAATTWSQRLRSRGHQGTEDLCLSYHSILSSEKSRLTVTRDRLREGPGRAHRPPLAEPRAPADDRGRGHSFYECIMVQPSRDAARAGHGRAGIDVNPVALDDALLISHGGRGGEAAIAGTIPGTWQATRHHISATSHPPRAPRPSLRRCKLRAQEDCQ